ncbi:hypothetical protein SAMN05421736_11511 [Evansella caseinilytica]|uniref:Uncharacterized protein n=1 Tax=Evansella caseinilytica TaxID=1503961 RepID=A0A1H3TJC7_9BACI|nr:hypothetical protein SAMN05421736_11511 [Evansella caseinilytica]
MFKKSGIQRPRISLLRCLSAAHVRHVYAPLLEPAAPRPSCRCIVLLFELRLIMWMFKKSGIQRLRISLLRCLSAAHVRHVYAPLLEPAAPRPSCRCIVLLFELRFIMWMFKKASYRSHRIPLVVTAFSTCFFQQVRFPNDHSFIERFTHIVNRQCCR